MSTKYPFADLLCAVEVKNNSEEMLMSCPILSKVLSEKITYRCLIPDLDYDEILQFASEKFSITKIIINSLEGYYYEKHNNNMSFYCSYASDGPPRDRNGKTRFGICTGVLAYGTKIWHEGEKIRDYSTTYTIERYDGIEEATIASEGWPLTEDISVRINRIPPQCKLLIVFILKKTDQCVTRAL